jgi:type IV secretion system protein VirD4
MNDDSAVAWLVLIAIWLALVARQRGRKKPLVACGTGRFATKKELKSAGMLGASSGLILGRVMEQGQKKPGEIVRLPNASCHTLVCSPTGGGKGVSMIIPFLLTCPDSCVVIDFKGENALLTAEHRARQFGHRIVILDPFHLVTR